MAVFVCLHKMLEFIGVKKLLFNDKQTAQYRLKSIRTDSSWIAK